MAGAYLTLCPEYSFVCENSLDGSIVGYALAAPDAKTFYTRYNMAWLPEMRLKYPVKKQHLDDSSSLSPIEQMALSFHSPNAESNIPAPVAFADEKAATGAAAASNATGAPSTALHSGQPWGVMSLRVRPDEAVTDASLPKRLVMLVLACLRASGTIRMFVEPTPGDIKQREFYSSLGFTQMDLGTLPAADQPGGPEVSSSPVIPALNICMSRNF